MKSGLLFFDETLSRSQRAAVACLQTIVGLCVLALGARVVLGTGAGLPDDFFTQTLPVVTAIAATSAVIWRVAAIREQREIWVPLAIGLFSYSAGALLWALWLEELADPPYPSIADVCWLLVYPLGFGSVVLATRAQVGRVGLGPWLDGLIAALSVAAISAALALGPLTDGATGSSAAIVTNFAYPLADVLFLGVLVAGLVVSGWRLTATSAILGCGALAFTAGDLIYLESVATGEYVSGLLANLMWVLGLALLALAPWTRAKRSLRPEPRRITEAIPTVFALGAVGVHIVDQIEPVGDTALALSTAALVIAVIRLAGTARDERQLHSSRIEARTDELTGLPNRRALNMSAAELLEAGDAPRVALLLIDLNNFKELNDTLGHGAGDELLLALGGRLGDVLGPGEMLARLGGDEFAVLVEDYESVGATEALAWRLLAALEEPFPISDIQIRAGASIGIACAPLHGTTPRELLRTADIAMYRAKEARTGVQVHDTGLDSGSIDRLSLAGQLQRAFALDEIVPFIQPQIDPRTGRLTGAEALARWDHPERGILAPGHFIPVIEQMNLSRSLTTRMLETTADVAVACRDAGLDIQLAVNLTAANLMDEALVGDLSEILRSRDVPFDRFRLEVTEGTVMADPAGAIAMLERMRELGLGVSLDDFGTDHSSMSYLSRLPVDELKVDRSFIADLHDSRTAAIVNSILTLARTLEICSTAEGVEDRETLDLLAEMECDTAQGFYIARPMPCEEFVPWATAHESTRLALAQDPSSQLGSRR